uniref:Uncharacterized protein n=1 Tax=Setaria italica TaxID=4555 RepID=K3YKL5_SETIT
MKGGTNSEIPVLGRYNASSPGSNNALFTEAFQQIASVQHRKKTFRTANNQFYWKHNALHHSEQSRAGTIEAVK